MMYVDRSSVAAPASLTLADGKAERERLRARNFYARIAEPAERPGATSHLVETDVEATSDRSEEDGQKSPTGSRDENAKKSFAFEAYKSEDVKQALATLFSNKCAYCESECRSVSSMHVEHYRPKQRIAEEPGHPGYWWLASTWENLLPACQLCNSGEYQEVHRLDDEEDYLQDSVDRKYRLGKLDHFPISGLRTTHADQADEELPLLIDPSVTDPTLHLTWISDDVSLVAARVDANGVRDERGFATYRVLGLNRQPLVERRTGIMLRMKKILQRVERDSIRAIQTENMALRADLLQEVEDGINDAKSFGDPAQPYSMMAKALLRATLNQIGEKIERARRSAMTQSHQD